jgi:hypothetical protein
MEASSDKLPCEGERCWTVPYALVGMSGSDDSSIVQFWELEERKVCE